MSGNTLFAIFWLVVGAVIVTALLVPTPEERIELERIRSQQKKHPSCLTKEEVIKLSVGKSKSDFYKRVSS